MLAPLSPCPPGLRFRWLFLVAAMLAVDVAAQSPPVSVAPAMLDPIVVTASRTPQRLLDLVADVTVIDADEIARAGAEGIVALLQRQPGVEIIRNGGPGSTSGVFLRGANAAQTLVLIDGMRVASASSGATALEAIPLGADRADRDPARAGVEPVWRGCDRRRRSRCSRAAARPALHANASLGYGTFDTWAASAGISGGASAARGSVRDRRHGGAAASMRSSIPANFSYDPDRDGYRNASVSAHGELRLRRRPDVVAAVFREPARQPVRRGRRLRRPHGHDADDVAGRVAQSARAGLAVASCRSATAATGRCRRRGSATFRSTRISANTRGRTTSTLPAGALTAGARAARGARRDRRRIRR